MAEKGDNDDSDSDSPCFIFPKEQAVSPNDSDDENISSRPDLFNENLNKSRKSYATKSNSVSGDMPKREENPFSFKHFIRTDSLGSNSSYQHMGARPKIYSNTKTTSDIHNSHPKRSEDNMRSAQPEFTSALPDFVRDHLVLEQSYLSNEGHGSSFDTLPDFAVRTNRTNDYETIWDSDSNNDFVKDLPNNKEKWRSPLEPDFPLDLPVTSDHVSANRNSQSGEVGSSKSLPDFLSDGPIHSNRISDPIINQNDESGGLPNINHRSRSNNQTTEIDTLKEALEAARRQISQQATHIDNLRRDMAAMQRKEKKYIAQLSSSVKEVEGNLNKSNERVVSAEKTVLQLRQENKRLLTEIKDLKEENNLLRDQSGAIGGVRIPNDISREQLQRSAQELRGAANTAEHSLRQLLTGLGNLRTIADSIENINRIKEHPDPFLSDYEDEPGPAL